MRGSLAWKDRRRCLPVEFCRSTTGRRFAWARLMADAKAAGRPRSALDMIIAAVAVVHKCMIVTDNEKDFAGLQIVNPMRPK